ncbi:Uncharacterised protein [Vibrio cholerae]|nr:Uncharacterised protein [Vibrio cholerae]
MSLSSVENESWISWAVENHLAAVRNTRVDRLWRG